MNLMKPLNKIKDLIQKYLHEAKISETAIAKFEAKPLTFKSITLEEAENEDITIPAGYSVTVTDAVPYVTVGNSWSSGNTVTHGFTSYDWGGSGLIDPTEPVSLRDMYRPKPPKRCGFIPPPPPLSEHDSWVEFMLKEPPAAGAEVKKDCGCQWEVVGQLQILKGTHHIPEGTDITNMFPTILEWKQGDWCDKHFSKGFESAAQGKYLKHNDHPVVYKWQGEQVTKEEYDILCQSGTPITQYANNEIWLDATGETVGVQHQDVQISNAKSFFAVHPDAAEELLK